MSDSRFRRWAAMVGDFGSPFFAEERQRDVWNEASAVGLQVVLWAGLIVSAGAFWIGGPAGLPYGLALMAVVSAGALVTVLYAEHRGIRTLSWQWVSGRRLAVVTLVFLVYLGGLVRAVWEFDDSFHGFRGGFRAGSLAGLAVVLLVGGVQIVRQLRAADRAEGPRTTVFGRRPGSSVE